MTSVHKLSRLLMDLNMCMVWCAPDIFVSIPKREELVVLQDGLPM